MQNTRATTIHQKSPGNSVPNSLFPSLWPLMSHPDFIPVTAPNTGILPRLARGSSIPSAGAPTRPRRRIDGRLEAREGARRQRRAEAARLRESAAPQRDRSAPRVVARPEIDDGAARHAEAKRGCDETRERLLSREYLVFCAALTPASRD
jgi:hypothetical protein